jgi:hypothetical protein
MKINLNDFNLEDFFVKEHSIDKELIYLICPKITARWNYQNLILRSSVWNQDGELISASFPKFFNWLEQPDIFPIPNSLKKCSLMEKLDGSTLIISNYKNHLIIRTRGSLNISHMLNYSEIQIFKNKYPKIFQVPENCSYICEWVSPTNQIILKYSEPDIYLTNIIKHEDYSLSSQEWLDEKAKELNIKRPNRYYFDSIDEMITSIENLNGQEGICVYYNNDQNIRKVKSIQYLTLHRFKNKVDIEELLDLFLEYNLNYNDFISKIIELFDHEIYQMIQSEISQIYDASKEVNNIINHMKSFVSSLNDLERKEQAIRIQQTYGKTNRSSYVFNFLDNKELKKENLKKLYFQILNKK